MGAIKQQRSLCGGPSSWGCVRGPGSEVVRLDGGRVFGCRVATPPQHIVHDCPVPVMGFDRGDPSRVCC